MLHPQEPHADEFTDTRVGVGIHLQIQVDDVDGFYDHCLNQGAMLERLRRADGPELGLARVRLRDPDGFVWSIYEDKSGGQWTG